MRFIMRVKGIERESLLAMSVELMASSFFDNAITIDRDDINILVSKPPTMYSREFDKVMNAVTDNSQ